MKELGITVSATGTSRRKVYKAVNTTGGAWAPASILLSSESADVDWEIYIDKSVNNLAVAAIPTLAASTTGGTIPRSTPVYVRISTVDGSDIEGPPSLGVNVITGSGTDTNKVNVSWIAISGAAGYKVYVGTEPGMEAFYDLTTGTSLDVLALPENAIETTTGHSYFVFGAATRLDSIPLQDVAVNNNITIDGTPAATTKIAISIPLK